MKKSELLILIMSVCFVAACDKKEAPIPEKDFFYWGEVTALQNGEPWEEACLASDFDLADGEKFNMISRVLIYNHFLTESMGLGKIPFSLGTYMVKSKLPLDDGQIVGGFGFYHDDQTLAHYDILEVENSNFMTITSYDSSTLELKGIFDLTFLRISGSSEYPDTVRFTNGLFHTKIIER